VVRPVVVKIAQDFSAVGEFLIEAEAANPAWRSTRLLVKATNPKNNGMIERCQEIRDACESHGADAGIFVLSPDADPLYRFFAMKRDVFVIWDPEQPLTGHCLRATFDVGLALALRHIAEGNERCQEELRDMLDAVDGVQGHANSVWSAASRVAGEIGHSECCVRAQETIRSLQSDIEYLRKTRVRLREAQQRDPLTGLSEQEGFDSLRAQLDSTHTVSSASGCRSREEPIARRLLGCGFGMSDQDQGLTNQATSVLRRSLPTDSCRL